MKISFKILSRKILDAILLIFIILNILIAQDPTVGLILNDITKSYNGYTLFAPNTSKFTYLIDNDGRLVNRWESEFVPGLSAYLLEDGHLLRSAAIVDTTDGATITGGFQKYDWDNNLVWEFYYGTQHHDIEPMPNGNVLMVVNNRQNKNAAIQAGRDPSLIDGANIRSLSILEIAYTGPTTGNIVWQWNAWDHLIQDFDNSKDNFGTVVEYSELIDINFAKDGSQDWLHTNSVDYNEEFDQILVSNRNTNEIWIIDHSTTTEEVATHTGGNSDKGGDLLYRWGNPIAYGAGTVNDQKLFGQHDAHWIESGLIGEGNILFFNNGLRRPSGSYSSVDEIITPIDGSGNYSLDIGSAYDPIDHTWSYTSPTPEDFYSPRYGGSQRLPNGNTLICNSDSGEFFEVTPTNEIVWKYINPVTADGPLTQGETDIDNNRVSRCYRYGQDYPGLAEKDLSPGDPIELYPKTAVTDDLGEIAAFNLYNNYPNPFNPITTIEFAIPERELVTIAVFDMLGNKIKTLVVQEMEPGLNSVTWDSKDDTGIIVSSGVYFYSI